MQFIVIFGPAAVGKMTVGMELAGLTGYTLFHNHMSLELSHLLFKLDNPLCWSMSDEIREVVFKTVGNGDLSGFIFTYVWALDQEEDRQTIMKYCDLLGVKIKDVIFVELYADQSTRLQRDETELRLRHKPTKRNIPHSKSCLKEMDEKYILNSDGDFIYPESHIRVDNTNLSAQEVAQMVVEKFKLA